MLDALLGDGVEALEVGQEALEEAVGGGVLAVDRRQVVLGVGEPRVPGPQGAHGGARAAAGRSGSAPLAGSARSPAGRAARRSRCRRAGSRRPPAGRPTGRTRPARRRRSGGTAPAGAATGTARAARGRRPPGPWTVTLVPVGTWASSSSRCQTHPGSWLSKGWPGTPLGGLAVVLAGAVVAKSTGVVSEPAASRSGTRCRSPGAPTGRRSRTRHRRPPAPGPCRPSAAAAGSRAGAPAHRWWRRG